MSFGGSGSGGASVTETHGLPEYSGMPAKIENYLIEANTLSNSIFNKYAKDTYPQDQNSIGTLASPMDNFTSVLETQGISKIGTRASSGDATLTKGRTIITNDVDGVNLNTDEIFGVTTVKDNYYTKVTDKLIQDTTETAKPSIDQLANMLGNFGSSGHQISLYKMGENAGESLLEAGKTVYYDDYKRERQDQHNAAALAHVYSNETIRDMEMLRKAGTYVREYEQGKLTDAFKQYMHVSEFEVKRLDILGNAIRSLMGSEKTKTEPSTVPSVFSQVAGLALTALPIYGEIMAGRKTDALQEVKNTRNELALTSTSGINAPLIPGITSSTTPRMSLN